MASNDWLKMTTQKAGAMRVHFGKEERLNYNHSNEDIDKNRSHLNWCIGCSDYDDAYKAFRERVAKVDKENPPLRVKKDRITAVAVEVPCPHEIFNQGTEAVHKFFDDVFKIYQDFFGKENVHGGFVHVDEMHEYTDKDGVTKMSMAHMHTLESAYVEWKEKDKKTGEMKDRKGINGKNFVTKSRMTQLNNLVEEYCQKEWNVHFLTGETPQKKSVEQLKKEEEINRLTKQINELTETLTQQLTSSKNVIQNLFDKVKGGKKLNAEEVEQFNAFVNCLDTLEELKEKEILKDKALNDETKALRAEKQKLQQKVDEINVAINKFNAEKKGFVAEKKQFEKDKQKQAVQVQLEARAMAQRILDKGGYKPSESVTELYTEQINKVKENGGYGRG